MSFNYRILQHPDEAGDPVYGIHTVYYGKRGEVEGWGDRPIVVGNSVQELLSVLEQLRDALAKPILDAREHVE